MRFWRVWTLHRELKVLIASWRLRRLMGEVSHEHESRVSRWR